MAASGGEGVAVSCMISVVIPVYNHERELELALDSICRQTYKNVEIIVVDDGSEPSVKCKLSNIKCFHQPHLGAPATRNRGFRESKGEYVIFWDADVIAEPEMLEKMIAALGAQIEASFAYSNFYFGRKKMPAQPFDICALKQKNYIHSTSLIRREAVIPWDESLKRFQDWDLWLTMAEQGKVGEWVPEYLFRILPRRSGMSSWLPAFAYKKPWKWLPIIAESVRLYGEAKQVIFDKHRLIK